jgi:hypothetical protein
MPLRLLLAGCFFFICSIALSQDLIVRTSNDTLKVLIVDMTKKKIKFIFNDSPDADIYEVNKSNVKQIIFENGSKLTIVSSPYELSNDMILQEKNQGIKIDIFSPLLNHFVLGYEREIHSGLNVEIKGGLIATNLNSGISHAEGFILKGGVKFLSPEKTLIHGVECLQPLAGSYFKPEFIFGQFTKNIDHKNYNYTNYAVNILFGRQHIYHNWLMIDYFAGMGYGIQNSSKETDFTYAYSHLFFGKKFPLIVSGGILIGVVF